MRPIIQLIIALWVADLFLAVAYLAVETELLTWVYWEQGKRSEIFRNFGLLVAAGVGVGFGIWRAMSGHLQAKAALRSTDALLAQSRTAEAGHITDRFSRAVDQLGSGQLPVRLGAIYALWRLAEDWPDQYTTTVVDILCAFVRNAPRPEELEPRGDDTDGDSELKAPSVRPDVQAILDVIGQKPAEYLDRLTIGYQRNLNGAFLRKAILGGANLGGADLRDADLKGADLNYASLVRAHLEGATLEGANLSFANLEGAGFWGADLKDAKLAEADLTRTGLAGANLTGASFWAANLTGVNLIKAKLGGANLTGAHLTGAHLTGANLTDANLTSTDFEGAMGLTQAQLDSACVTRDGRPPKLPEGFNPPTKICVEDP